MAPCTHYSPSVDSGSWLIAVGNLLLARGIFKGAKLSITNSLGNISSLYEGVEYKTIPVSNVAELQVTKLLAYV